ncbi:MAG TPA: MASE1 domain-containing protein [Candidatus Udaeobacter sp.]|nr:MASE1 domain-containing protein [Candidatus Udaeobacter sp.]
MEPKAVGNMQSRRFSGLPLIGAFAIIYIIAGKIGLNLASLHASASPVWPPAGIALAAMLLLGYRAWPAIFVGAFIVNLTTAGDITTSVAIATGNTFEAVAGAWLVNRFADGKNVFDRPQGVFKFALVAAISAVISPLFGVTSLALDGFANWTNYGAIWLTWWLGDVTGDLIFTPLVLLWGRRWKLAWKKEEAIEVGVLLLMLTLLSAVVFGGWLTISAKNYPIAFICGPIVIWTAFRFTQRETAMGIFILSVIAVWGTVHGFGPFVGVTENQSLLTVQSWTAVLAITAMALSAGMAERRRVEEELQQQKSIVEAANRTKDHFLAMLSHELRTPLTPVISALESLEIEPTPTEDTKSSLAMIRRNIELETQLIDDLLDFTRIAKDKMQLRFAPVDAHQAVSNVVEMCRAEARSKTLHVHLILRAKSCHVTADAAKFQQIIWNLLKNAIKFTPEGGGIEISSDNPSETVFSLSVGDTGIGMEPEVMQRIFDPFEQGNRSFEHRVGGLGLGLAISKSLAQAHGGTLTAQSDGSNRGSTFTLSMHALPKGEAVNVASQAVNDSTRQALKILLVDDHHDTCAALEKLLTRRGHLVAVTHDVRSAMQAAVRNKFDLLISDIALPDGTGMDLMMQMHAIANVPGIAISGFGNNGDIERSLQAGFSEHLIKPIKLDKLEAAIERALAPN